ncbi:MAG: acyl-CoA dehydrogenase family protein [Bacteroidales bacterium]|nr:acyl-CoA dehydrogenase family protein [Bacteroidales bacterium]
MNFYQDNKSLAFYLNHPKMAEIVRMKENDFVDAENDELAPKSVEDAIDNYDKVLDIVGELCGDVLDPNAEAVDIEGPKIVDNAIVYAKGTQQNHEAMRDAGLYGMALPRKYNGLNISYVPYVMAAEMVSRADAGFANIWGLQDCAETILKFADDAIKDEYLPRIYKGDTCSMDLTEPDAGSDLQSVQLKATFDEKANCWRLNGVKRFITNGDADIKLVLARSEEGSTDGRGLSLFVYDRKEKAVTVRRIENKMGIHGSPTAELVFNNAPAKLVGDRKMGLIKYVMSLMNGARLGVGAQSVGLAEAAVRDAEEYADQREQFGKKIKEFVAVQDILDLMRAKTDAARSLLYETARYVETNKKIADMLTPVLKMFASEWANQIAYDDIQIHGGSGFMKEYKCERLYRDARILTIYEGTSQLQVVAAARFLGNGAYLKYIAELDNFEFSEDLLPLRDKLRGMTEKYKEIFELSGNKETHHRRLVEAVGYIIMGYLMLQDTARCADFRKSCEDIIKLGKGEIAKTYEYVKE